MRKRRVLIVAAVAATMVFSTTAFASEAAEAEPADAAEEEAEESAEEAAPEVLEDEVIVAISEIEYPNIYFDFEDDISEERAAMQIVPDAADIALSVEDENGATGVVIVASAEEGNEDYYLNAMVAGNALIFTGSDDNAITAASSSAAGDLEVEDGKVSIVPAPISAADDSDEIISFEMEDGTNYDVHTRCEMLPNFEITGEGVAAENAGVYSFVVDKVLLRINTDSEILYYRDMNCVGETMAENFATQVTDDGTFYTVFVELREEYRNANGGFSSGFYLVMDDNFTDTDEVTLLANDDANHTHGEGYLDQHEFLVLGPDHYITLSYTPVLATNLPEGVEGIDGGSTGYVWAGIFQEVKDGEILNEINTTDYPFLYESAVEKIDYAGSTDQGTTVVINDEEVPSLADGWMDYVHPNSMDYTLDADGNVDKLLVSMRDQCSVYQFDFASGEIEWILGGKARTLSGYDDYTTIREDDNGTQFTALTYAQHYARYINKNADGTLDGDPVISIFDNQTGDAPFIMAVPVPTLTRTMKVSIDEAAGTAEVFDVIDGPALNELSDKYHIASHCGSVQYDNDNSVTIGWGLHGVIDNIGVYAPEGTITDIGFDDLRQGSRPILTEYDMENNVITYELSVTRNPLIESSEGLFSYRVYKTAE